MEKIVFLPPGERVMSKTSLMRDINAIVRAQAWLEAQRREREARRLAKELLPRPLHWLVDGDHIRLLQIVYRLRPKWRPTLVRLVPSGSIGRDSNPWGVEFTPSDVKRI